MKRFIPVLALLGVFASFGLAQCHGGSMPAAGDCHPGGMRQQTMDHGMGGCQDQCCTSPEMIKELGLSDDQVQKLNDLQLKHRTAMIKLAADIKIAHLELSDLMAAGAGDSEIKAKAKTVSTLRQKMEDAGLDHMLACRKVLTAEQQKKIRTMCPMMHGPGMMNCCPGDKGQFTK